MEPTTTEQLLETSAGWKSVAELASAAARKYGDEPAMRLKRDGEWQTVSYSEVGETVSAVARGLVDLGIQGGDRVCLLADTSPEWTFADFGIAAAGAVVVPIYPTNSPEECEWVVGNSEARAIICENAAQLDKIRKVKGALPALEHLIAIDPDAAGDGVISLEELRERGRGRDAGELEERAAAVKGDDPYTFVYTSGTTGPPKGCVLTHRNFASVCGAIRELSTVRPDDVAYLYLPLAHVFARIVELATFDFGAGIAYMAGGTRQIIPELSEVKPHLSAFGPADLREALHARERSARERDARGAGAVPSGGQARREGTGHGAARRAGAGRDAQAVRSRRRADLQERAGAVRRPGAGGRHGRRADRPGDPGVLLRRRHPGARGLRDDRDHGRRHDLDRREPQVRHGRAAVAGNRGPDRRRRRDADQGPEHLRRVLAQRGGHRARPSSTAGSTRATSARSTRTAT